MRSDWRTYLADLGARIDDDHVENFGDPREEARAALHKLVISDLSHLALVRISGADAGSFLQAQFCNDVKQLDAAVSQLSGYANPKGRLIALFRLFCFQGDYYLLLPHSLLASLIQKLSKYVLRAKVKIEDAGNDFGRIGVAGEAADNLIATYLSAPPDEINHLALLGDVCVLRIPGTQPRFILIADHRRIYGLWSQLMAEAQPIGEDAWGLLDVQAGLPTIYPQTSEIFIPQMLNLDQLGGLSFNKGCYPGQEIIARMHYLGKLKRRMFRFRCDAANAFLPGSVLNDSDEQEEELGRIVDARLHPDGGYEGLAVVRLDGLSSHEITLTGTKTRLHLLLPTSSENQ